LVTAFSLEPIGTLKSSTCQCCGRQTLGGHGFVYEDGNALAIYFATLFTEHEDKRVSLAIGIGEWNDDGSRRFCTAFGMEVFTTDSEVRMTIVDSSASPWGTTELLGPLMGREQALAHHLKTKMFQIADHIVMHDPKIAAHLGA
jgi:hypothetical protein